MDESEPKLASAENGIKSDGKDYAAEEREIVRKYVSEELDKLFAQIDEKKQERDCAFYNTPGFR